MSTPLPLGLTSKAAASLLGTSASTLSATLSGARVPGATMARRLSALDALEQDSVFASARAPLTVPELVARLRDAQEAALVAANVSELVRPLTKTLSKLRFLSAPDARFLLTPPGTSGDPRYDALVVGAVQHWCDQVGLERPDWATSAPLSQEWVVYPVLEAWCRSRACAHLALLNIVLDDASMTSA